jgi:hypothetical protein
MTRPIDQHLMDEAFDAYLHWRDECDSVSRAYGNWRRAPARDARSAFRAYQAALDREEHAAGYYQRVLSRIRTGAPDGAVTAAGGIALR